SAPIFFRPGGRYRWDRLAEAVPREWAAPTGREPAARRRPPRGIPEIVCCEALTGGQHGSRQGPGRPPLAEAVTGRGRPGEGVSLCRARGGFSKPGGSHHELLASGAPCPEDLPALAGAPRGPDGAEPYGTGPEPGGADCRQRLGHADQHDVPRGQRFL